MVSTAVKPEDHMPGVEAGDSTPGDVLQVPLAGTRCFQIVRLARLG